MSIQNVLLASSGSRPVEVRIERHADAALALRLERAAFRRGEFEILHRLQLDPNAHFVARDGEGNAVGAVACTVHVGADLAWIGGMVVLPHARRMGVARRLLHAALEHARSRDVRIIGLDASEEGRPLYESEGFRPATTTTRWQRTGAPTGHDASKHAIYPASAAELMEIAAFDGTRFGANRAPWLAAVLRDLPGRAFVAYERASGRLAGYALGQERYVGPVVADDREAATLLLLAVEASGAPPTADLLDVNASAGLVFSEAGYRPTDGRCVRMTLGGDLPGLLETQYAVGAWALG